MTVAGDSQAERVRVSEERLWFGCRTLCHPVSWQHGPGASHGQGTSPAEEAWDLQGQQRSCAGPTLAVPEDPSEREGREQRWCRREGAGSFLRSSDQAGPASASGVPHEHGVMAFPAEARLIAGHLDVREYYYERQSAEGLTSQATTSLLLSVDSQPGAQGPGLVWWEAVTVAVEKVDLHTPTPPVTCQHSVLLGGGHGLQRTRGRLGVTGLQPAPDLDVLQPGAAVPGAPEAHDDAGGGSAAGRAGVGEQKQL